MYTDPEEIYLVRKDGTVIMFDANNLKEEVKIGDSQVVSGISRVCICTNAQPRLSLPPFPT